MGFLTTVPLRHGVAALLVAGFIPTLLTPVAGAAPAVAQRLAGCAACHGAGGISEQAGTPSIAGLPADYTLVQLFLFREGLRPGPAMAPLAQNLSDDELRALAEHFAGLPPDPPDPNPEPAVYARGRALAKTHRCASCHLSDYSGGGQVPRVAGQREDYLLRSLKAYKSGERPGYEPAMASVMVPLSETDIGDLAHFLAHFSPGTD